MSTSACSRRRSARPGDLARSDCDEPGCRGPAASRVRSAWPGCSPGSVFSRCCASLRSPSAIAILSLDDLLAGLAGSTDGIGPAAVAARLPRTVLAVLVGAALAMAGTTFQAVTRNPLADPGILGVTSGASLAVVCGIAFFGISNPYGTLALAIVGAAGAAVFVYAIGSLGQGGATPLKLALAGAASTAAFTSFDQRRAAAPRRRHGGVPVLADRRRRRRDLGPDRPRRAVPARGGRRHVPLARAG